MVQSTQKVPEVGTKMEDEEETVERRMSDNE